MLQKPKKRPEVRQLEDGRYGVFADGDLLHVFDSRYAAENFAWDFYLNPRIEVLVFDTKDAPVAEARGIFSSLECAADWLFNTFDWEWNGVEGMWVETIPSSLRDALAEKLSARVRWMNSAVVQEDADGFISWNKSLERIAPEWFPQHLVDQITDEIWARIEEANEMRMGDPIYDYE